MTPRSIEAFESIKSICEEYLQGRYELEVIDVHHASVAFARDEQIIAVPHVGKEVSQPFQTDHETFPTKNE